MATEVKRRRGTTAQHLQFTGAEAEITVDTDKYTLLVHDDSGSAPTGHELLRQDFSNVTTLKVDTTYSETGNEVQGEMYWNSDEETVTLVTNGVNFDLGQTVEIHVNSAYDPDDPTPIVINKGEVVYAFGTLGNSGRITVKKMIADGTIAAKRVLGIAAENIQPEGEGKIIKFGKLRKINTNAYNEGDILYVSTSSAGSFQTSAPSAGDISLPLAYVVTKSANVGEIFVRVTPIDENAYQAYDAGLTDIAGLTPSDGNFIVGDGSNWVAESGATALASLGAQAQDPQLDDIAGLTPTDGNFIVGNGSNFVAESGNTARTSLGLGTGDSPTFTDVTLTGTLNTNEINTQSDLVWDDTNNTEVWNTSDYYINGALNIASNVYITDQLDVGESVSIGTTLNVTGNTTISGTLDAPTLNTGQGDNELYAMNQDVQTTDGVIFDTLSVTNNASVGGSLTLTGEADFNSTMNIEGAMTTQNTIQSDNFDKGTGSTGWLADGATGFAIEDNSGTYDMYVDSLTVRGSLRVFELIAKQISAIGGTEILSVANGVVESSSGSAGSETVTLEDPNNTLATAFADNDLVLVQRFDPNDPSNLVKQEFRTVSVASGLTLTLTTTSGAPTPTTTLGAGDFIVAYGNTDNGAGRGNIIYRNVEGQPIVRLHAGIDSYADFTSPATTTRIAYGDLNGFSGLSSQTFGFFAGADDGDHVLIKDDGLFFKKDNSTVLAELTSNTFKVGDTTNFLSFNGSAFNIQTNTFDLATSTLVVDSTANKIALGASADSITIDGTEVGFIADGSGEFKAFLDANNFIRLANSSLNIKSQQFNLESSTIQLGDSIELSTSQITTTYDYSGSTLVFSGLFNNTYNYFGYLEDIDDINPDGYVFRVGDATNFMELNTANNIAQIKFDTFDLTSGNLGIKSEGTSFPSASINDSSTSTPNTSFLSNVEVVPVDASDNNTVRFKFDYSVNFSTSFSTNFKIRVEGRLTGTTTWQDITLYTDLEYIQHAYTIVTQTLGTINVANESGPTEVFLRATGSGSSQYAGTITFYLFVSPDSNFDGFRLALDEVGGNASSADASNISGISYDSNLELNPNGVFIRLSDTLVNSNGNIFQDRALLTS